jgi:hypothetical protein
MKTKIDLVSIIRQSAKQVWGSDEREMLYAWLSRNTEDQQIVEVDLSKAVQADKAAAVDPTAPSAEFWKGLVADHIDGEDVNNLIATIEIELANNPVIVDALNACNLLPTTRANWLAAMSAVNVLLAHELGQTVARDMAVIDEAEEPAA